MCNKSILKQIMHNSSESFYTYVTQYETYLTIIMVVQLELKFRNEYSNQVKKEKLQTFYVCLIIHLPITLHFGKTLANSVCMLA